MIRDYKTIFLALFLALTFLVGPAFASKRSPQACVEELLGTIQKIKEGDKLTDEQKKANYARSEKALKYLNIAEISQKTLGKYWSKISDEEKASFSKLLGELFFYVAFPNSGKFFADLDLIFAESEIEKAKAFVPMTVVHKNEGEIEIDFFLQQNSDDWKVVDVHMDGVSMRNNLRSQFYKIIAKKNFEELVRRMEKKLKEAKA
jgi:phospholipid transport system substrate-binding protein